MPALDAFMKILWFWGNDHAVSWLRFFWGVRCRNCLHDRRGWCARLFIFSLRERGKLQSEVRSKVWRQEVPASFGNPHGIKL
jgi:hypothetical protein